MKISVLLFLALAAAPPMSIASQDRTDFDTADSEHNAAYELLIAGTVPADRERLRTVERTWLAFRNASCGRQAHNACATRLTRKRTRDLAAQITADHSYLKLADAELIQLEQYASDACHATGLDEEGVMCTRRAAIGRHLERRGWCWGPDSPKAESDQHWIRAGANCSREAP
jgi:hypothetical protein